MRTETINIYKFNELDIKIQDKVIEHFRNINDYPTLKESMYDECKHQLKEHSIEIVGDDNKFKVLWSLSYSQGDGSMFEGLFMWDKYTILIKQNGHYYHYNSKVFEYFDLTNIDDIEMTDKEYEDYQKDLKQSEKDFNDIYVSICKGLEKYGYSIIESEDSEESIKEMIDANDYEFYNNGEIV